MKHCISQWGYDFRPSYLEIAEIRSILKETVPVLALTATATPEVVKDIQQKLLFKEERVFQKSFIRNNLTYFALKEEDKLKRLLKIVEKTPGTGIVYVRNRKKTREIALFLRIRERARKQNAWSKGLVRIIVATNAFGMGIDKPDVRFVVHMDLPDTLEAYFQEAGRGGRDERRAYAVLLYENADIHSLRQNFENSFPPLNTIKNVYEALSNYFQIPVGVGEGLSFDFDNNAFAATYQLKPLLTYHALKFIEKAGLITFTDPYANASKVFIRASREDLYKFQVEYANYDYLIKLLLRSYSGLFTNFTRIYETELAKRSNQSVDNIVTTLKKIEEYEIIDYHQQTEQPRVVF